MLALPSPAQTVARPEQEAGPSSTEAPRQPPPSLAQSQTRRAKAAKSPFLPKKAPQRPAAALSTTQLQSEIDRITSALETTRLVQSKETLERRREDMESELAIRGARERLDGVHLSAAEGDVDMASTSSSHAAATSPSKRLKGLDMASSLALEELSAARDKHFASLLPKHHPIDMTNPRPADTSLSASMYYHDSDEDDEQDEADFDTEAELGRLGIDFSADGPG